MRMYLVALAILLIAAPATLASDYWVGVCADADGQEPELIIPEYPLVAEMYVVVSSALPISSVSFHIDRSIDLIAHTIYLGPDYLGHAHTGDPLDGVTITLEGCPSGIFPVMKLLLSRNSLDDTVECGTVDVLPYPPPATGIPLGVCGDGTIEVSTRRGYVRTLPPYFPFRQPPDGISNVSTDVFLGWAQSYCYEDLDGCPGGMCSRVYFGSDPSNLTEYVVENTAARLDVAPLLPNTTYYWRLDTWFVGESTVWSFTTGDDEVATEESTWGEIKSLYR